MRDELRVAVEEELVQRGWKRVGEVGAGSWWERPSPSKRGVVTLAHAMREAGVSW